MSSVAKPNPINLINTSLDRQRRKNEALAKDIFGKGRIGSTPNNGTRRPGTGPSLASRVGVSKVDMRLTLLISGCGINLGVHEADRLPRPRSVQ